MDGLPHLLELGLRDLGGEVQVDREVAGLEPGNGDVAEDDVEAEPGGFGKAEGRDDEEGVGRESHVPPAHSDDSVVDAVVRSDDDIAARGAEPRIDDPVEKGGMDLAEFRQLLFAHRLSLRRHKPGQVQRVPRLTRGSQLRNGSGLPCDPNSLFTIGRRNMAAFPVALLEAAGG